MSTQTQQPDGPYIISREELEAAGCKLRSPYQGPLASYAEAHAYWRDLHDQRDGHGLSMFPGLTIVRQGNGFNLVYDDLTAEPACLTLHNALGFHEILGESREECIATLRRQLLLDTTGQRIARDLTARISLHPTYNVQLSMMGSNRPRCIVTDLRASMGVEIIDGTRLEVIERFLALLAQEEHGEHWRPHGRA